MKKKGMQRHIVNCPSCGKEVLDHMTECPFCHGTLTPLGYREKDPARIGKVRKVVYGICIGIAVVLILAIFLRNSL